MPVPLICEFDGDSLRPLDGARAKERMRAGRRYQLEIVDQRSEKSHRHYFACIREAWLNLSDEQRAQYASPEHLRAKALVRCGYYTEKAYICTTGAEMLRLKSVAELLDEFCVVVMEGEILAIFRAKSQSYEAMGRQVFEESKHAVLAFCADLIGVTPEELARNAGAAT